MGGVDTRSGQERFAARSGRGCVLPMTSISAPDCKRIPLSVSLMIWRAIVTSAPLSTRTLGGAGDGPDAPSADRTTFRLGPVTAHDVSILVFPGEPPSLAGGRRMPDAIVGQDLLRNRHVWFWWSTGRLYL